MRSLLSTVLCFSMAICVLATNFERGKRQPGDYLSINKIIVKIPIIWKPMETIIDVKCPSNEIITYVRISSIDGIISGIIDGIHFVQLSGDVGTTSILVKARRRWHKKFALTVQGNVFERGERLKDDHCIIDQTILELPNSWEPIPRASIDITCPDVNDVVSYIKISSIKDKEVDFQLFDNDMTSYDIEVRRQLHPVKMSNKERIGYNGNDSTTDNEIWADNDNDRVEREALL
ncbi:hypothetical protein EAI_16090 [Harpegnathos saltator]|uniref:Uncharacterized protein n=1 Tax=Harpegnathos saltator TaxID=610380 RepID=E2B2I1_HARSA|nr:hypothetical protein EAI_16090 [Harpegnathos saltator]